MDSRDGELTSEPTVDALIGELETLGQALATFQQAYLELLAAVQAHCGTPMAEADMRSSVVLGTARG